MKSMDAKQSLNALVLVALILTFRDSANADAVSLRPETAALVGSAKGFHPEARPQDPPRTKDRTSKVNNNPDSQWSEGQKRLRAGSKIAVLKTGMSERYFDRHFRIVEVFDKPGDRRVVWKFSLNDYEAIVNDSIGYYTEGGRRIDIHSVTALLSSTSDIKRTIPRRSALRIMRACIGDFAGTAVEYRGGSSGRAGLFLTASAIAKTKPMSRREALELERKREAIESREKAAQEKRGNETDVIDGKGKGNRPPVVLGFVNLETGKCSRGIGQAGSPKPQSH